MIKQILMGISDLVYPPLCLLCRKHSTAQHPQNLLCHACREKIRLNVPPFCFKCSRHMGVTLRPLCRECRRRSPSFDFAWGAVIYNEPLKILIHKYKYGQKTLLRHVFAKIIINFIYTYNLDISQFDLIIPIPLFSSRLRERGFNQAELLAREISHKFQIPLSINTLRRARNTPSQARLSLKNRWTNTKGAFTIKRSENIREKSILLVDDLLTTGATASEAAAVLKHTGAKTVGVLALAIAHIDTTEEKNESFYRKTNRPSPHGDLSGLRPQKLENHLPHQRLGHR